MNHNRHHTTPMKASERAQHALQWLLKRGAADPWIWDKAKIAEMGLDTTADYVVMYEGDYDWPWRYWVEEIDKAIPGDDGGAFCEGKNGWTLCVWEHSPT